MENMKVCVTGGSGYVGSSLVKKLLEKGYTVHTTLRNLDDKSKVNLLMSLPGAETRLRLFQANLYNPEGFGPAIEGCQFVFHVASPTGQASSHTQVVEGTVGAVRSIASACINSQTVKRLIYTASVLAASPLKEDGSGYKTCMDESCWTPLNLPGSYADFLMGYTKSKTLAEKEALSYNQRENGILEVVSLVCGLTGGDTVLPSKPTSVDVILSPVAGDKPMFSGLEFMQEIIGSVPFVHIDDVCDAHIFCMENPSLRGRFICASTNPTTREIGNCYKEIGHDISEEFLGGADSGIKCDLTKLIKEGFEYKFGLKEILQSCLECAKRLEIHDPVRA